MTWELIDMEMVIESEVSAESAATRSEGEIIVRAIIDKKELLNA
jgi:hypothetical protein